MHGTYMNLQGSVWCLGNLKLLTIHHIPFFNLLHELNIYTFTHMEKDFVSPSITCWNLTGLILVYLQKDLRAEVVSFYAHVASHFYCY
jgi:hypothetical protein